MRMQWTCRFLYKFPQDPSCLMGLSYGCLMGNFQGIGLSYGCLMEISKRGAHFCAVDVQYTLRRERPASAAMTQQCNVAPVPRKTC